MASCAASRRPRRRLAWSSESAASPKMMRSPSCVVLRDQSLARKPASDGFAFGFVFGGAFFVAGRAQNRFHMTQSRLLSMMMSSSPRVQLAYSGGVGAGRDADGFFVDESSAKGVSEG